MNAVKIGETKDLKSRFEEIQKNMPYKLEIYHLIRSNEPKNIEKLLHNYFKEKRLDSPNQREWFLLNQEDLDNIKK
jgi:hypothetical protein